MISLLRKQIKSMGWITKKELLVNKSSFLLAEAVGFEPTDDFTRHSISSRDRYDHFDTPPYQVRCGLSPQHEYYTPKQKKSQGFF